MPLTSRQYDPDPVRPVASSGDARRESPAPTSGLRSSPAITPSHAQRLTNGLQALENQPHKSLVGVTLSHKYRLERQLGSGGFGDVYEATNVNTGGRFAIKTLHAHLVAHAVVLRRFLAEARAATRIQHENVIRVFDLDVEESLGLPYIVQELLAGETLEARLVRAPGRRLSPEETLRLVEPVMRALIAAHALGVVHRDLKPANIFLSRRADGTETPTVIDFGIAKFSEGILQEEPGTHAGSLLGSVEYMSPEQARGDAKNVDARTDVWAMGVVLYEMLTGRLPYEAESVAMLFGQIQFQEPIPLRARDPFLPHDLVAVVERALQRERDARFPTIEAFLQALLATRAWKNLSFPPPAPSPVPAASAAKPARFWWIALGVVLVAASLAGVITLASILALSRRPAPPPAQAARASSPAPPALVVPVSVPAPVPAPQIATAPAPAPPPVAPTIQRTPPAPAPVPTPRTPTTARPSPRGSLRVQPAERAGGMPTAFSPPTAHTQTGLRPPSAEEYH